MASAAKSKKKAPVRDIKPQKNTEKKPRGQFTVRQLQKEDGPTVEPLIEDNFETNDFEVARIEDEANADGSYDVAVNQVEQELEDAIDEVVEEVEETDQEIDATAPRDSVIVKFSTFVNLVASRDFSKVLEANPDEQIIISSNLLTELAGVKDEKGEKKVPLVFVVGIAIGVVLTYILFST